MPWPHIDDPTHWRGRAAEARAVAEKMTDSASQKMMLNIAADYDRLAEHTEEQTKKPSP
jgi:hypothetical protein